MTFVRVVVGAALLVGPAACGDDGGEPGGGGGGGNSFNLDYRAGKDLLLDLRANGSLTFNGAKPTLLTLPPVRVAQTGAVVQGNGQQVIELTLSSTESLDEGERFSVRLEFSRAHNGGVIDGGGTLNMSCDFNWYRADTTFFDVFANCDVRRSGTGYELTVKETYDEDTQLSGKLTFSPVPNEIYAFYPGYDCSSGQTCLSLNPTEYEPQTGFCMPSTNLKSEAEPCHSGCSEQLRIKVDGAETCICTAACGRVDSGGGGGDPPVCHPAYGCIDF